MYDFTALWATHQLKIEQLRIVVINNSGGKIFSRMFDNPAFENNHSLNFKPWSDLFSWAYVVWRSEDDIGPLPSGPTIIEVIPDNAASDRFWQAYSKSC